MKIREGYQRYLELSNNIEMIRTKYHYKYGTMYHLWPADVRKSLAEEIDSDRDKRNLLEQTLIKMIGNKAIPLGDNKIIIAYYGRLIEAELSNDD